MARTAQTAGGDKQTQQSCLAYFTDHAGNRALRYGYQKSCNEQTTPWPPTDYTQTPWFCFQVYLSIDLHLDKGDNDEDDKSGANEIVSDQNTFFETLQLEKLTRHLCVLFDLQTPQPLWEIYTLPSAFVLDFVEHSRKEILHRQKLRRAGDASVPLIPQVQANSFEERKSAFLFAVDNDQGWHKANDRQCDYHQPLKWPDKTGPLWAQFDPRLPASVNTVDREWQVPCYRHGTDDIDFYSEQQDVKTTRVQEREFSFLEMQIMYPSSWYHELEHDANSEDKNDGMDFGDELNDALSISKLREMMLTLDLDNVQVKLDRHHVVVEKGEDRIRLFNHKTDTPPHARHSVYVPFCHDNGQMLEPIARTFTASFLDHLCGHETLDLHFHRPPAPTDTSILTHFRSLALPLDFIGTFTNLQASRSFSDPFDYIRPQEPHSRRLFPLALEPHIFWNDPATFQREPYKKFILVIDRPDFQTAAAVRFLLADGGHWRGDDGMRSLDYCEMEIWRAESMGHIVRRLMMVQPQE
jgi:hypothetical protein